MDESFDECVSCGVEFRESEWFECSICEAMAFYDEKEDEWYCPICE
jgi:predicted RNA-binding Zn-ribbon protein involved in translation (DUF1610 family)